MTDSKRTWAIAVAVLAGSFGCGAPVPADPESPPADRYASDTNRYNGFRPNPDFHPVTGGIGFIRSSLRTDGEVIVIDGDDRFVTDGGGGSFGITADNQVAIVDEVLANYADEFDTIQIYTTFTDEAHAGFAYYSTIKNSVSGIGIDVFNARADYGLPEVGRLSGFSNMNTMSTWGELPSLNVIKGYYHGVIAHELSHRWLLFMTFKDGAGMQNLSLLGRDQAHWSALAQAYGSVSDGNHFRDNGDGTFTNIGKDEGFAPLDKYAMGKIPASEVPDFFYLVEAVRGADMLTKTSPIDVGDTIRGRKIDVRMSQVIAQMGARNPPAGNDDPYYRMAMVLVSRPGQSAADYQAQLDVLKNVNRDFPETWREWTGGAMCTKVTERCPEPKISIASWVANDGGDQRIGPGESFNLELSLLNEGIGTAEDVKVTVRPLDLTATAGTDPVTAPAIGEGATVAVGAGIPITVSSTIPCGKVVPLELSFATKEGPIFKQKIEIPVGVFRHSYDPMDEAPDWTVNPDGTDGATAGSWELGVPDFVSLLGLVVQPNEDHTPGESKLSFHTGLRLDGFFSRNDVDGGQTTLESPVFALSGARAPELVFYSWHFAYDLSTNPARELGDSPLIVEVTNDAGATWKELGRVEDETGEWTRHVFPLKPIVSATNRVKFRFSIADNSETGTVEAGLDDLEIIDYLDTCPGDEMPEPEKPKPTPKVEEEGCGCRATQAGSLSLLYALLLVGSLGLRRR